MSNQSSDRRIRFNNRASFRLSLVAHCKVCSQIRRTRQPARRNAAFTSRSRLLFADNFRCQNSRLFLGLVACLGQPCQKHPSTKIASRACRKTKSTFTRSSRGDEAPINFGFLIFSLSLLTSAATNDKGGLPPPPRNFIPAQQPGQRQFRVLVPTRADARHHLRPLRLGENVSHQRRSGVAPDSDLLGFISNGDRRDACPTPPRHNQPPAQAAVPFHPPCAGTSGHKVPTIARRPDTIPRPPVRPRPRDAMPRRRSVSTRAASRCPHLQIRPGADREIKVGELGNATPGASFSARRTASE